MKGVIDRIEGEYAVVELDDETMANIKLEIIPKDAKEGDVLIIDEENNIVIDRNETENRRKLIEELTEDLWDD